jgi:hypothetical protein
MKKFYVEICADQALHSEFFALYMPEDTNEKELKKFFDKHTRYGVKVSDFNWSFKDDVKTFLSFLDAIDYVQGVKLYTVKKRNHYEEVEVADEVIDFRLSECFRIDDIGISYKYVDDGITFFYVRSDANDILFNDKKFKKLLDLKVSKTDAYYKTGTWRFFRSKTDRTKYKMVRVRKEQRVKYVETYIDKL